MGNDISWAVISEESVGAIVFVDIDYSEESISTKTIAPTLSSEMIAQEISFPMTTAIQNNNYT